MLEINLYSDTQTKPTAAMYDAMRSAEVGDEQHGRDPTVNARCERVAALLGKEAALFLPTGTMCNVIAFMVHCRPGDEIIAHETSHVLISEGGGAAVFAGAQIRPLSGAYGRFDAGQVIEATRPPSRYSPRSRAIVIEQTANFAGGTVWLSNGLDYSTPINSRPLHRTARGRAHARRSGRSGFRGDGARHAVAHLHASFAKRRASPAQ